MAEETPLLEELDTDKNVHVACCSIDRYTLSAKVSYFLNNARYSICDYLVLFYVQAGLSPFEAGMVNGLQHIGGMIAAPLIGLLADRYGFHRLMTISLCAAVIITTCIQPYFTTTLGFKPSSICPNVILSNTTTLDINEYMHSRTNTKLFYLLLGSAILASSFDGSIISFVEVGVLTKVQNSPNGSNIGKQRIMAALGSSFGAFAYSLSLQYFTISNSSCFVGVFITYFVFAICLAVSFNFLFKGVIIKTEERSRNVTKQLLSHIRKPRSLIFLLSVLFNGMVAAITFSYLFLFLKNELNASTLLFGATISFNCVSGVVIYAFSEKLITFLGGPTIAMCVSCFAWAIRLLCLAYLMNPYYVLLIDIFHGFTFSLFKVAYLQYVNEDTDVAILSSVCGVVNALWYSCSFLLANVVGGKLYEIYGPRSLFLGLSAACAVCSILMFIFVIMMREHKRRNEHHETIKVPDQS